MHLLWRCPKWCEMSRWQMDAQLTRCHPASALKRTINPIHIRRQHHLRIFGTLHHFSKFCVWYTGLSKRKGANFRNWTSYVHAPLHHMAFNRGRRDQVHACSPCRLASYARVNDARRIAILPLAKMRKRRSATCTAPPFIRNSGNLRIAVRESVQRLYSLFLYP